MTMIVGTKFRLLVPACAPNLMVVTTEGCTGMFEQDRSTAIKITVVPYQKKKKTSVDAHKFQTDPHVSYPSERDH